MKKTLKFSLISILGILLSLCMMFSTISFSSNAEVTPSHASFDLYDGAYIKGDAPQGIRFEAGITQADKSTLPDDAKFGMLISLDTYVGNGELTHSTERVVDIEAKNWLSTTPSTFGSTYTGFFGSIVGGTEGNLVSFDESHYSDVFVARGYVTYGGQTYYTPTTVERTLAGTAKIAQDKDASTEYIDSVLDNVNSQKVEVTYDVNGDTTKINKANPYKGELLSSLIPETEPTQDGKLFGGWFKENTFVTPAFEKGIIKSDITAYAKFADSLSYSTDVLYKYYSADGYSFDKDDSGNYLLSNKSSSTPYIGISKGKVGSAFKSGNYVVLDVMMVSRTEDTSRFMSYAVYDQDNNVVPKPSSDNHEVDLGARYKVAIEITSAMETDSYIDLNGDKAGDIYVYGVTLYTPESYAKTFTETSTGITTYRLDTIYKSTSNTSATFTIGRAEMPNTLTDARDYTLKFESTTTDATVAYIPTADYNNNTSNYLVFEAYIASRGSDTYRFRNYEVYDKDGYRVNNTDAYTHDVDTGVWYYVVKKVSDIGSSRALDLSDTKICTVYISSVKMYTEAAYTAKFSSDVPEVPAAPMVEYGANFFKSRHSAFETSNFKYEATAMPEDTESANLRTGTYLYYNASSDTRRIQVDTSVVGSDFVAGNYIVIDAYVAVADANERFHYTHQYVSLGTYNVFTTDGTLVDTSGNTPVGEYTYGVVPKTWYSIAVKINAAFISTPEISLNNNKNSQIYISGVRTYTPEGFVAAYPNATLG